ncbi:MAG: hypothetical protein ACK57T_19395 [Dolichospermum sp.]
MSETSFLFPVPCSLFPGPCSLFPVPCSLFPVPCSLAITTIFNANLLITDYRLQIWTRQKNTSNSSPTIQPTPEDSTPPLPITPG